MTILWHSVKYPPKTDGTYYYKSTCSVNLHDLRERSRTYFFINTLTYTTDGGWNSHRDFDGAASNSGFPVNEEDQWAEVEYVSD